MLVSQRPQYIKVECSASTWLSCLSTKRLRCSRGFEIAQLCSRACLAEERVGGKGTEDKQRVCVHCLSDRWGCIVMFGCLISSSDEAVITFHEVVDR